MQKDLIFFGIQGCGKGTQAKNILNKYVDSYSYFSSGDVFRALTSSDNSIGNYLKLKLEKGELIKDEVTINLFNTYFETVVDSSKLMLLDGYPRSSKQANNLVDLITKFNRNVLGIYFELSEQEAIDRMLLRGRNDDNIDAIKYRIKQYYNDTKPIIDYLGNKFEIVKIDANQTIEKVFIDLDNILN